MVPLRESRGKAPRAERVSHRRPLQRPTAADSSCPRRSSAQGREAEDLPRAHDVPVVPRGTLGADLSYFRNLPKRRATRIRDVRRCGYRSSRTVEVRPAWAALGCDRRLEPRCCSDAPGQLTCDWHGAGREHEQPTVLPGRETGAAVPTMSLETRARGEDSGGGARVVGRVPRSLTAGGLAGRRAVQGSTTRSALGFFDPLTPRSRTGSGLRAPRRVPGRMSREANPLQPSCPVGGRPFPPHRRLCVAARRSPPPFGDVAPVGLPDEASIRRRSSAAQDRPPSPRASCDPPPPWGRGRAASECAASRAGR